MRIIVHSFPSFWHSKRSKWHNLIINPIHYFWRKFWNIYKLFLNILKFLKMTLYANIISSWLQLKNNKWMSGLMVPHVSWCFVPQSSEHVPLIRNSRTNVSISRRKRILDVSVGSCSSKPSVTILFPSCFSAGLP